MEAKSSKEERKCCNPFSNHSRRRHNLCSVTPALAKRFVFLQGHKNICVSCRSRCYEINRPNNRQEKMNESAFKNMDAFNEYLQSDYTEESLQIPEYKQELSYREESLMEDSFQIPEYKEELSCPEESFTEDPLQISEVKEELLYPEESLTVEENSVTSENEFIKCEENAEELHSLKKENIKSALNVLFKEFDLKPLNSTDLSEPEVAEKKFDDLLQKLKTFFITN